MRLLEITNDFPPVLGGIENFTFSLVARWKPDDVVVLTRSVPGCEAFDRTLPFEVRREPVGTLLPTPGLSRRALEIARARSIDLVHFAAPLPLALLGPRIRRRRTIPYAVSLHGGEFVFPASVPLGRPLLRKALAEAAVVLPNSSYTQDAFQRLFGPHPPSEVVTPGVDPDLFSPDAPAADVPGRGPVVVSVGRLVARKGAGMLIRAMPRILRRNPEVRLLVVGDGAGLPRLRQLASSLEVAGSVCLAGAVPWREVSRYYAAGAVFAHPSRERFRGRETEGFGIVYLEAAASGLPVVAGQAGGVRDAVVDGETGYIVDGRSLYATSEAILRLLEDPELARAMGRRGRRRVLEGFTWDAVAERFRAALAKHLDS